MLNADLPGAVSPEKAHAGRTGWYCTAPFSGTVNHRVARGMRPHRHTHMRTHMRNKTPVGAPNTAHAQNALMAGADVRQNRYAFDTHSSQYT